MIRCDLYCRVSTLEQATEGYSLQEQESRLRSYAEAQGWTVNACYVDAGMSGATMDRPGLKNLISDASANKIDRVVTYKIDRLSRSQKDTLYLLEEVFRPNGVSYVSMTESFDTGTPLGMAMVGILSVFAQLEREQISERMMMGRIAAAKAGKWRGGSGVPIGYRYIPKTATEDGRLVAEPYEAQQVKRIFEMFLQGNTFHAIYDYCHDNYHTSYGRFGGGGANIIPNILANRAYIGEIKYQGNWYEGQHEPIIDRPIFDRAQAKLAEYRAGLIENQRAPYKSGHMLTGLLFCGECGARWAYHSCSYTKKSGEKVVYGTYTCYTKNAHKTQRKANRCSIPVWPASELEDLIWSQVCSLRFEDLSPTDDTSAEAEAYEKRIADIDQQLERLIDLYTVGTLPMGAVQSKSEELQTERSRLADAVDALRLSSCKLQAEEAKEALASVSDVTDPADKRRIIRLLIKRITLNADKNVKIEWNF